MSFTLSLRFTGLCALVPRSANDLDVVLVNARDHAHGAHHETHYCMLLVPYSSWDQSGRAKSFGFDGLPAHFGHSSMVAFLLDGERLSITPPGAGNLTLEPGTILDCPSSLNKRAFAWGLRMADVGAANVATDVLTNNRDLLARLKLTSGTLGTSAFALNLMGQVLKWQFKDAGGGNPMGSVRAAAEELELIAQITNPAPRPGEPLREEVKIASTTFGGTTLRDLILTPISGRVEVWLVNMPLLDVLMDRSQMPRQPDYHFAHFHRIAAVSTGTHIPWPNPDADNCGPPPTGNISNPRCPPAIFTA
jgi:hypothetical protein